MNRHMYVIEVSCSKTNVSVCQNN